MSSLPSSDDDDDNDATVLRPSMPVPPAAPAAEPTRTGNRLQDTGDPHAPTLSAGSLASGAQGQGNALPIGSYLGEFELTEVVGEGGFGIVYLAVDHSLQRQIALKEYMPSSLAERTSGMQVSSLSPDDEETFRKGLDSFINEARLLAQFDHPSLVKVHRFWEANGTAYMVMPFYQGPTLKQTLRDMGAPPDEAWLLGLLDPLTQALAVIHAMQCYHRDIAPDNILLLAGSGQPLLLDFGAARRVIGDANQVLTVILKPGYAPLEQYAEVPGMQQGPWTDVYALAAVLYFAITGKKPPAAVGRLLNDQYVPLQQAAAGRYSASFLAAIDRALTVKPAERTQDIDAFRADLGFAPLLRDGAGALAATGGSAPSLSPAADRSAAGSQASASRPAKKAKSGASVAPAGGQGKMIAIGLGVAGLAVAAAAWWFTRPAAPPPGVSTAAVPASPPPTVVPTPAPAPAPVPPPPVAASTAPFSVVSEFRRIVAGQTAGFNVEARTSKTNLRIDKDKLSFTINSSRDGFFYVLSHAPDGQLLLFFPNQQVPTNSINAGESITLPQAKRDPKTGRQSEEIILTEPPGNAQMLVIVSRYPRDFSALGAKRIYDWSEFPTGPAAELLARQQPRGQSIYAGRLVCPSGAACTDEYGAELIEFEVTR
jgi:serine/threonine protein kinase